MKLHRVIFATVAASLISTTAFASMGNATEQKAQLLQPGVSTTQILSQGNPERFELDIQHPSTLTITSEHFSGESSEYNTITGKLYNASGGLIATASSPRGHFTLTRQVEPGRYELKVTGATTGSRRDSNDRYELHVSY